jgi:hypothetical protein
LDALGRIALDPLTGIDRSTHRERSLHKLSAAFSTVFLLHGDVEIAHAKLKTKNETVSVAHLS